MRKIYSKCRDSLLILAASTIAVFARGALAHADAPAAPAGAAPAPGAAAAGAPAAGPLGMMVPFALMFGVIYFLMIRPQQKRLRDQQDMLGGLKYGDDIVTTSGILGKVTGITDKVVTVEIADRVNIKILKSQISQIVKGQIPDTVQQQ